MSSGRRSTGKRLRFEVFKRDAFTCQYCGAQPPAVVLVVDHVVPYAGGGETSIENLVTACEPCNQGKSNRPLESRVVRPDADLLYLEAEQEAAELRRYLAARAERDALLRRVLDGFVDEWIVRSGLDWAPDDSVLLALLDRFSIEIVEASLVDVAKKLDGKYLPSSGRAWIKYLWAVARTMARQADEPELEPEPLTPPTDADRELWARALDIIDGWASR